jgi:hypothetical protein
MASVAAGSSAIGSRFVAARLAPIRPSQRREFPFGARPALPLRAEIRSPDAPNASGAATASLCSIDGIPQLWLGRARDRPHMVGVRCAQSTALRSHASDQQTPRGISGSPGRSDGWRGRFPPRAIETTCVESRVSTHWSCYEGTGSEFRRPIDSYERIQRIQGARYRRRARARKRSSSAWTTEVSGRWRLSHGGRT